MLSLLSLEGVIMISHLIVFVIGVTVNTTLLAAVVMRTPPHLKVYSFLVFCATIDDLLANFIDLFIMQRLVPIAGNVVYVSSGICKFISSSSCYMAYGSLLCLLVYSMMLTATSFSYRCLILSRHQVTRTHLSVTLVILMIPVLVYGITFVVHQADDDIIRNLLITHNRTSLFESGMVTGNVPSKATKFTAFFIISVPPFTYFIIIFSRIKSLRLLTNSSMHMSEKTRSAHKNIITSLTYHAALPSLYIFGVSAYVIMKANIYQNALMESVVFIMTSIPPSSNAFFTLHFISPYRRFVFPQKSSLMERTNGQKSTVSAVNPTNL